MPLSGGGTVNNTPAGHSSFSWGVWSGHWKPADWTAEAQQFVGCDVRLFSGNWLGSVLGRIPERFIVRWECGQTNATLSHEPR